MIAELGQQGDGRDWEGMERAGVQMGQAKGGLRLGLDYHGFLYARKTDA